MSSQSHLLDCLEKATAGKEKRIPLIWTEEMKNNFEELKTAAKHDVHKLALPARHEQLTLLPDATVKHPGLGFILLVKRQETFYPVYYLSFKLKPYHNQWYPCEQEALGVSVAVEKARYYITHST